MRRCCHCVFCFLFALLFALVLLPAHSDLKPSPLFPFRHRRRIVLASGCGGERQRRFGQGSAWCWVQRRWYALNAAASGFVLLFLEGGKGGGGVAFVHGRTHPVFGACQPASLSIKWNPIHGFATWLGFDQGTGGGGGGGGGGNRSDDGSCTCSTDASDLPLIHVAAAEGNVDVLQTLLLAGGNIDALDTITGFTALVRRSERG